MWWRWTIMIVLLIASLYCLSSAGALLFILDGYHHLTNPHYSEDEYLWWLNFYGFSGIGLALGFAVTMGLNIRRLLKLRRDKQRVLPPEAA